MERKPVCGACMLSPVTDCSLPGFTFHGMVPARILEWVAIFFSGRSSCLRDLTRSPALQADSLPSEPRRKTSAVLKNKGRAGCGVGALGSIVEAERRD